MNTLAVLATLALAGPAEAAVPGGLPATDLALTMTDSPDPVGAWLSPVASSRLTYHLTVTNLGTAPGIDVMLTVPPPDRFGVVTPALSPPCVVLQTMGGLGFGCDLGDIGVGSSMSVDVSFYVLENAPAVLVSGVASVSAASPDPDPANDAASVSTTVLPSVGGNCAVTFEGDAGLTPVFCAIHRMGTQVPTSIVTYTFGGGTATPGVDFVPSSGTVTFGPGETSKQIPFEFVGDTLAEPHDTFLVQLTNPVGAVVLADPSLGWQVIHNDDLGAVSGDLTHGFVHRGPVPGHLTERAADVFWVETGGYEASYEVVLDETSGDASLLPAIADPGGQGMAFGALTGTGGASSLRFTSYSKGTTEPRQVMAVNEGCSGGCGPDDTYRLRVYETTLAGSRFNNAGSQESLVILHNTGQEAVGGRVMFWASSGVFLWSSEFSVPPRGSYVLRTSDVPPLAYASGSITVVHDAPYGTLVGKVVGVDPANGFSFDTPLVPRPR